MRNTLDAPSVRRPDKHEGNTSAPCKATEGKALAGRERTERAPGVGRVFFPLDDELGLLSGNLAPHQHEHLVHVARWMPCAWAARLLEH